MSFDKKVITAILMHQNENLFLARKKKYFGQLAQIILKVHKS